MRKALLLLVLVSGCDMYWGNGDDVVCNKAYEAVPSQGYVDPSTGQCEYLGGGGGYCGDPCAPCPSGGAATGVDIPNWAMCSSQCTGLDQTSCEATAGCHADFQGAAFWQCVAVPSTGVVEGGSCTGLDAQTCSEHDDCVSNYQIPGNTSEFTSCAPETQTFCVSDTDCSSGQRCDTSTCYTNCPPNTACPAVCEGVCVPDAACTNVDCGSGYHCEEQCYPCDPTTGQMCPPDGTCAPQCVPDQDCSTIDCGPGYSCAMECNTGTCYPTCIATGGGPGECYGQVTCNSAPPACPANTTPGVANGCYTGYCIPVADCSPQDPGLCYATVTCNSAPPGCPMGTLPGVKNGCWSGYCIPTADCEVPACETLTTESACTSRTDCSPVYAGTNCTCTPSGCTCQTLTFERCESALMPL